MFKQNSNHQFNGLGLGMQHQPQQELTRAWAMPSSQQNDAGYQNSALLQAQRMQYLDRNKNDPYRNARSPANSRSTPANGYYFDNSGVLRQGDPNAFNSRQQQNYLTRQQPMQVMGLGFANGGYVGNDLSEYGNKLRALNNEYVRMRDQLENSRSTRENSRSNVSQNQQRLDQDNEQFYANLDALSAKQQAELAYKYKQDAFQNQLSRQKFDNDTALMRNELSSSQASRQNQHVSNRQKQQGLDQQNEQYYANLNANTDRQQAELARLLKQDAFLNQLAQQKANQDNAQYYAGLDQTSENNLQNVNLKRVQNAIAQQQANQQNDQYYARLALDKNDQEMDNKLKAQELTLAQMKAQQAKQDFINNQRGGKGYGAIKTHRIINPYSESSVSHGLGFASGGYVDPNYSDPFRIDYNFLAQQRNQQQANQQQYDQARQDAINSDSSKLGSQYGIANMQNQTDVLKANNDYSLGNLRANNDYSLGNRQADITDRNYQGQLALGNKTQDQSNALAVRNQQLNQDKFDFKKGFLNSFGKSFLGFGKGGKVAPQEAHPVMPSDTVPAFLTPHEFVFSVPAVDAIGVKALTKFNKDAIAGKLDEKDEETAERIKGTDNPKEEKQERQGYANGGLVDIESAKPGNYLSWQTPTDQQVVDDVARQFNSGPQGYATQQAALTVNPTDDLVENELDRYMSDPKNSWQWERYSQRTNEIDPSMSSKFAPTATKMGTYSSNGAAARDVQYAYNKIRAEKKAQIAQQMGNQQRGGSRGGQHSNGLGSGAIPMPGRSPNVDASGQAIPFRKPGETSEDIRIQEILAAAYNNRKPQQLPMPNAYYRKGFALGGLVDDEDEDEYEIVNGVRKKKRKSTVDQIKQQGLMADYGAIKKNRPVELSSSLETRKVEQLTPEQLKGLVNSYSTIKSNRQPQGPSYLNEFTNEAKKFPSKVANGLESLGNSLGGKAYDLMQSNNQPTLSQPLVSQPIPRRQAETKPMEKVGAHIQLKETPIQQNERGEYLVDYGNGNTVGVKSLATAQRMRDQFQDSGKALNDYHDINQPFVKDSETGRVARGLGNIGVVASGGNNALDGSMKAYNDPISQVQNARENGNKDYAKMADILNRYSDRRAIDDQTYRDQKFNDSLQGLTPDEQFNSLYRKSVQDLLTPIDVNASPTMRQAQEQRFNRGLGINKLITEQQDFITKAEEAKQEKADKANAPVLTLKQLQQMGIGDLPEQEMQKVIAANTKDTLPNFFKKYNAAKTDQDKAKQVEIFSMKTGVPIAVAQRLLKVIPPSDYIDIGAAQ